MKIAVWRTGHEIADTVAGAVFNGLNDKSKEPKTDWNGGYPAVYVDAKNYEYAKNYDINIGYGILRGMADVFRECDKHSKPWFCIDKGYWKPGHYDGYYRMSLRGTQQCGGWPEPDYERWAALGLEIGEPIISDKKRALLCGPTLPVTQFFDRMWIDKYSWSNNPSENGGWERRVRNKGDQSSLDDDLSWCSKVATFNSSVGWEALRRGIPVESDPVYSIVGAWGVSHDLMATRRELFATMAACQLTLDEMRAGMLWPLMEKLLANHYDIIGRLKKWFAENPNERFSLDPSPRNKA